jgi:hypothetical protein
MIFRRAHLGQHPAVFRSLTGLTVGAFDRLLPPLRAASDADRRRRLDRPGRRRAVGTKSWGKGPDRPARIMKKV